MIFLAKNKNKFILSFLLGIVIFVSVLFFVGAVANAQSSDIYGVGSVEENISLAGGDIRVVIVRIINVALGLLGIIAVGIILYGGYTYMTAGGNDEQIGKAKKILINGVIGLVIILTAFTIVNFVIKSLSEATGIDDGSDGDKKLCGYCTDLVNRPNFAAENIDFCTQCERDLPFFCEDEYFVVKSITPSTDETGMNNISIRALFSRPINLKYEDLEELRSVVSVLKDGEDVTDNFNFTLKSNNQLTELTPKTDSGWGCVETVPEYREVNWIGGAKGDWSNATNWDSGEVPNANDNVSISDGAEVNIALGEIASFNNLNLVAQNSGDRTILTLEGDINEGSNIIIGAYGVLMQKNKSKQTISGDLIIKKDGYLSHYANSTLHDYNIDFEANNITIETDGFVYAVDTGFISENGPNAGGHDDTYGGGGAHGGDGGYFTGSGSGGTAYCDPNNPSTLGSGGGSTFRAIGGKGGGLIILHANNIFSNSGRIKADGSQGANNIFGAYGGGGGGGAINITAKNFNNFATNILATGAAGRMAGGGGGGCVYIGYGETYINEGLLSVAGGSNTQGGGGGKDGTAVVEQISLTNFLDNESLGSKSLFNVDCDESALYLPAGEYEIKVNPQVESYLGEPLETKVSCGEYSLSTIFDTATEFVKDEISPALSPISLDEIVGSEHKLLSGVYHGLKTSISDNSGFGFLHLTIERVADLADRPLAENELVYDYYHGPKHKKINPELGKEVDRGSDATLDNPFVFELPFLVRRNFELGRYRITVEAYDIDNNLASITTEFTILPDHCRNGVQDIEKGETEGVDKGGPCGVGQGQYCNTNNDCAYSFKCIDVDNDGIQNDKICHYYPFIEGVSPYMNGASGNWVTIFGKHFGEEAGKIEFANGKGGWLEAQLVDCKGKDMWNDEFVIVELSADQTWDLNTEDSIRLITNYTISENGFDIKPFDLSDDVWGPSPYKPGKFTKNEKVRPGLCSVSLAEPILSDDGGVVRAGSDIGLVESKIKVFGKGFGETRGKSNFYLGDFTKLTRILRNSDWSDSEIFTEVPNVNVGKYGTFVSRVFNNQAGEEVSEISNRVSFQVVDEDYLKRPVIVNIDPATTTPGSLITLGGRNFGDIPGDVFVAKTQAEAVVCAYNYDDTKCLKLWDEGDINNFPKQCVGSWQDDQVVVMVPIDTPLSFISGLKLFQENTLSVLNATTTNLVFDDLSKVSVIPDPDGKFSLMPGTTLEFEFTLEDVLTSTLGMSLSSAGGIDTWSKPRYLFKKFDSSYYFGYQLGISSIIRSNGEKSHELFFKSSLTGPHTHYGQLPYANKYRAKIQVLDNVLNIFVSPANLPFSVDPIISQVITDSSLFIKNNESLVLGGGHLFTQAGVLSYASFSSFIFNYDSEDISVEPVSEIYIVLKNNDDLASDGNNLVEIVDGTPLPSLCKLEPAVGPAPLPDGQFLNLYGINFSNNPTVYFPTHKVGNQSIEQSTSGWLSSSLSDGVKFELTSLGIDQKIVTYIPYDIVEGYSAKTGPIRVKNAEGSFGNSLIYEVNDCRNTDDETETKMVADGYKCCGKELKELLELTDAETGTDAGRWKPAGFACEGDVIDGGYVWRFTTGKMANTPRVVEYCEYDPNNPAAVFTSTAFPSPIPSLDWDLGDQACVNSTVAVRFNMGMDPETLTNDYVKFYNCGQGEEPLNNCVEVSLNGSGDLLYESEVFKIYQPATGRELDPLTWYRVELSKQIQSLESIKELGATVNVSQPLLANRSCDNGVNTAYCYDFKTGSRKCELISANVNPSEYITRLLGIVQDPRYTFVYKLSGEGSINNPPHPYYFYVNGQGDQPCTVLNVDGMGWQWRPVVRSTDEAEAFNWPGQAGEKYQYIDSRAQVRAKEHTYPEDVNIEAYTEGHKETDRVKAVNLVFNNGKDINTKNDILELLDSPVYDLGSLDRETRIKFRFELDDLSYSDYPEGLIWNEAGFWYRQRYIFSKYDGNKGYYLHVSDFYGSGANPDPDSKATARRFDYIEYYKDSNGNWYRSYVWSNDLITRSAGGVWDGEIEIEFIRKEVKNQSYDLYRGEDYFTQIINDGVEVELILNGESFENISTNIEGVNNIFYYTGDKAVWNHNYNLDNDAKFILGSDRYGDEKKLWHGKVYEFSIEKKYQDSFAQAYTTTSSLVINLYDPEVVAWWPDCTVACANANIGVQFNMLMMTSTFKNAFTNKSNLVIQKCLDEFCLAVAETPVVTNDIEVTDTDLIGTIYKVQPVNNLEINTWYKATVNSNIKSVGKIEDDGRLVAGAGLKEFTWRFKTKLVDAICALDKVAVTPNPFTATFVGQKEKFGASAFSSPDQCSDIGQELNSWGYGWHWSIGNSNVASVSNFSIKGAIAPYCGLDCLLRGSTIARDAEVADYFCGNGMVDPGEDCDIGVTKPDGSLLENPGVSCTFNCLRPGNIDINTCGNNRVDTNLGEECDPSVEAQAQYCTDICTWKGSDPLPVFFTTSFLAISYCGSGQKTAGEECEITSALVSVANPNESLVGCSNRCLHIGTPLSRGWCDDNASFATSTACVNALSLCGNGVVESGEECEADITNNRVYVYNYVNSNNPVAVSTDNPSGVCNNSCLLQNICSVNLPDFLNLKCVAGAEGCNNDCTLAGSSFGYSVPSLCADGLQSGVVGIGEFIGCEVRGVDESTILGLSPIQVVTAVGNFPLNETIETVSTTVSATAKTYRDRDGSIQTLDRSVASSSEYIFKCGRKEFSSPSSDPSGNFRHNDCGETLILSWQYGVAGNSCCYPRGVRQREYPADGAGINTSIDSSERVCRNTYLEVEFDKEIDEGTLVGNIIVARGNGSSATCLSDESLVPEELVDSSLAFYDTGRPTSFWARVWFKVKTFFTKLLGLEVYASQFGTSDAHWCEGQVSVVPKIQYINNGTSTSTIISLYLDELLSANSNYAVFLRGGYYGIKDTNGVAIRAKDNNNNNYGLDDVWLFQTGKDVCKIQSVEVKPESYLFQAPQQSTNFQAQAISQGNRKIQSIPDVYSWNWQWGPSDNQIFSIPANGEGKGEWNIVSSKIVEGEITAVAQAVITADVSEEGGRHLPGTVFGAPFKLTSYFCERPWPTPENNVWYPYKDADYNFSFYYCADAGLSDKTADDLPFLQSVEITDLNKLGNISVYGLCEGTGVACLETDECPKRFTVNQDGITKTRFSSDSQPSGVCAFDITYFDGFTLTSTTDSWFYPKPFEDGGVNIQTCNTDSECETGDVFDGIKNFYISEGEYKGDDSLLNNIYCNDQGTSGLNINQPQCQGAEQKIQTLRKTFFFADKNDDALGVQILKNDERLSAVAWYEDKFPDAKPPQELNIAGYDAITDGKNYYVNALNIDEDNKQVYNNIYQFSLSEGAGAGSQSVFLQILDSLEFNINLEEVSMCATLNGTVDLFLNRECSTDFDCLGDGKEEILQDEVLGVCKINDVFALEEMDEVGNEAILNDVDFIDSNNAWSVGYQGRISKTIQGMSGWRDLDSTELYQAAGVTVPRVTYNKVDFIDVDNGIIVGGDGTVLVTNNGGVNWLVTETNEIANIFDVEMVSDSEAWIVGGSKIYKVVKSIENYWAFLLAGEWNYTTNLTALDVVGSNVIWTVGGNEVYFTVNGGDMWEVLPNEYRPADTIFNDVLFIDEQTGFLVGNNRTVLKTEDGGSTWQQNTSINDAVPTSVVFNELYKSGNGIIWLAGSSGHLLRSVDNGENWSFVFVLDSQIDATYDDTNFKDISAIENDVWVLGSKDNNNVAVYSKVVTTCRNDSDCGSPNICMGYEDSLVDVHDDALSCLNEKTKLARDWQRIQDISKTQTSLNEYYFQKGYYPDLKKVKTFDPQFASESQFASYIPSYVVSRWPSWGAFGQLVLSGSVATDPLNIWECPQNDGTRNFENQTCWDANTLSYYCAEVSSVYEYSYDALTGDYALHVPFEYFTNISDYTDSGDILADFLDEDNITTARWCVEGLVYSLLGEVCGDGVVQSDSLSDEECDPPGYKKEYTSSTNKIVVEVCNNQCKWGAPEAFEPYSCGNNIVEIGEACDDGVLNGTYGHCAGENSYYADNYFDSTLKGTKVEPCQGLHPESCGNGQIDFGTSNERLEFCDIYNNELGRGKAFLEVLYTSVFDGNEHEYHLIFNYPDDFSSDFSFGTEQQKAEFEVTVRKMAAGYISKLDSYENCELAGFRSFEILCDDDSDNDNDGSVDCQDSDCNNAGFWCPKAGVQCGSGQCPGVSCGENNIDNNNNGDFVDVGDAVCNEFGQYDYIGDRNYCSNFEVPLKKVIDNSICLARIQNNILLDDFSRKINNLNEYIKDSICVGVYLGVPLIEWDNEIMILSLTGNNLFLNDWEDAQCNFIKSDSNKWHWHETDKYPADLSTAISCLRELRNKNLSEMGSWSNQYFLDRSNISKWDDDSKAVQNNGVLEDGLVCGDCLVPDFIDGDRYIINNNNANYKSDDYFFGVTREDPYYCTAFVYSSGYYQCGTDESCGDGAQCIGGVCFSSVANCGTQQCGPTIVGSYGLLGGSCGVPEAGQICSNGQLLPYDQDIDYFPVLDDLEPTVFNDKNDTDNDGISDACDACIGEDDNFDTDNDGIPDACDTCKNVFNPPPYQDKSDPRNDVNQNNKNDFCDSDLYNWWSFAPQLEAKAKDMYANFSGYCSDDYTRICQTANDCRSLYNLHGGVDNEFNSPDDFKSLLINSLGINTGVECISIHNYYHPQKEYSCSWDCQTYGEYCGDGIINGSEECDDGNKTNQDGCSNDCSVENIACLKQGPQYLQGYPADRFGAILLGRLQNFEESINSIVISSDSGEPYRSDPISQCYKNSTGKSICKATGTECLYVLEMESRPDAQGGWCEGLSTRISCEDDLRDYEAEDIDDPNANVYRTYAAICEGQIKPLSEMLDESPKQDIVSDGTCGNNIVDKNEKCDEGSSNGLVCTPDYDKSCQYCAKDCGKVITVDSNKYCGNGRIDIISEDDEGNKIYEACDGVNGVMDYGDIVVGVSLYPFQQLLYCNESDKTARYEKIGKYSCTNNCTQLVDTCVTCGRYLGGVIPKFNFIDPVDPKGILTWPPFSWVDNMSLLFNYVFKDNEVITLSSAYVGAGTDSYNVGLTSFHGVPGQPTPSAYGLISNVSDMFRIGNSNLCGEYQFNFIAPSGPGYADPTEYNNGDTFKYQTNDEVVSITNDYVISPPVEEGVFRVVVRWSDREQKVGANFQGIVYNPGFSDNKIVSYLDAKVSEDYFDEDYFDNEDEKYYDRLCRSSDLDQCWLKHYNGVYAHPYGGTNKTYVQSYTIDTKKRGLSTCNYAFVVDQYGKTEKAGNTFYTPIYPYKDGNLVVEIYKSHTNKGIYLPDQVIEIKKNIQASNATAEYWHAFDLVYSTESEKYEIVEVNKIKHDWNSVTKDFDKNPKDLKASTLGGFSLINNDNLDVTTGWAAPFISWPTSIDDDELVVFVAYSDSLYQASFSPVPHYFQGLFLTTAKNDHYNGHNECRSNTSSDLLYDEEICYSNWQLIKLDNADLDSTSIGDNFANTFHRDLVFNTIKANNIYRYAVDGNTYLPLKDLITIPENDPGVVLYVGYKGPDDSLKIQPITTLDRTQLNNATDNDISWYGLRVIKNGEDLYIEVVDKLLPICLSDDGPKKLNQVD